MHFAGLLWMSLLAPSAASPTRPASLPPFSLSPFLPFLPSLLIYFYLLKKNIK